MIPSPPPHTTFKLRGATFRFYLGDSLDVLARVPERSLDAIVTSPPYNLGIRYRTYDDTIPRARYLEWTGSYREPGDHQRYGLDLRSGSP